MENQRAAKAAVAVILYAEISKVAPIENLRLLPDGWSVDYASTVTKDQKLAADSVIRSLDTEAALQIQAVYEKRMIERPSIGDQLDAIWKGGEAMEAMRARLLKVKSDNPLPKVDGGK